MLQVNGIDLTFDPQTKRVDSEVALAPKTFLTPSQSHTPMVVFILTDWLSTIVSVGAALLPAASHTIMIRAYTIGSHNPL